MRKCEVCKWYDTVGKGSVKCMKREILFHYWECDVFEQDETRRFWGRDREGEK